jgi:hypothetical protein
LTIIFSALGIEGSVRRFFMRTGEPLDILIIGLGAAAVVIAALIDPLLGPTHLEENQKLLSFAIPGIFLIIALLFLFGRRHPLEQLSDGGEPSLEWPLPDSQRAPVNEATHVQPQTGNVQTEKPRVKTDLDVQALKDAIRNRGRHFR